MAWVDIEFSIENAEEVARQLGLVADLPSYLAMAMSQWVAEAVMRKLAGTVNYPSPRGTYQRTGRLGNSWYSRVSRGSYVEFMNATPYGGYVVGDEQAWMHRGHWWKASERVEEQMVELTRLFEAALGKWGT